MEPTFIPTPASICERLQALSFAQMQELSRQSEVPFTTLWKIRTGETSNPGIDTVRRFLPHIDSVAA